VTSATVGEATESIYKLIADNWNPADGDLVFDNESYKQDNKPFVRAVVRHFLSDQETLGPIGQKRSWERRGNLFVQIFTLANTGRGNSDVIASKLKTALEGSRIPGTGVVLFAGLTQEIGNDGPFFQMNYVVPFVYYERR